MAQVPDNRPTLVLASRSPRRRSLLDLHGFPHRVVSGTVDDGLLAYPARGVSPAGWTAALAWLKARAGVAQAMNEGVPAPMLVLAADTVVVHDGEVIGQPIDADDAHRIIRRLSNDEHEVITGIALVDVQGLADTSAGQSPSGGAHRGARRDRAFADDDGEGDFSPGPISGTAAAPWPVRLLIDRGEVSVGPIGRAAIEAYVASGQWRGKAGGYNLAERLEAGWPIDFAGDPTGIMGLPMARLAPILRGRLGIDSAGSTGMPSLGTDADHWTLEPDPGVASWPSVPAIVRPRGPSTEEPAGTDDPLHDSAGGVCA